MSVFRARRSPLIPGGNDDIAGKLPGCGRRVGPGRRQRPKGFRSAAHRTTRSAASVSGEGNLISGNTANGIVINGGDGPSNDNEIVGNLIGTTASGLGPVRNGGAGILIAGASNTQDRLPATDFSNVISGNLGPGIEVTSAAVATTIQNNAIGVGGDGATVVGNGGDGILLDDAPGALIGGTGEQRGKRDRRQSGNGIETLDDAAGAPGRWQLYRHRLDGQAARSGNRQNGIQLASSSNDDR